MLNCRWSSRKTNSSFSPELKLLDLEQPLHAAMMPDCLDTKAVDYVYGAVRRGRATDSSASKQESDRSMVYWQIVILQYCRPSLILLGVCLRMLLLSLHIMVQRFYFCPEGNSKAMHQSDAKKQTLVFCENHTRF